SSATKETKTKEEKDAELDKRIEALRKKNEALVKRYQEIEEDKKKAEQEGIAVTTPRKPRTHEPEPDRRKTEKENLTVTVDLSKPSGVSCSFTSFRGTVVAQCSHTYSHHDFVMQTDGVTEAPCLFCKSVHLSSC
ncbi:hypothetical protein XENORESO_000014, partial [Xenotaenia resolanae]